jgi:hypothetical protein
MDERGQISGRPPSFEEWPPHWHRWTPTDTSSPRWVWKADPPPVPGNHRVALDLHHILPWETIRNAWNVLVDNRAWNALGAWGGLVHLEGAIDGLRREMIDHGRVRLESNWASSARGQLPEAGDDPIMTKDDFQRRLCWSPWNLVEGPRFRVDDPGNQLDNFDPLEISRVFTIREINGDFRAAIAAAQHGPLGKDRLTATARILKNARPILRNAQLAPFKESWWRLVAPGQYAQGGRATRDATWRKAFQG